MKSTVSFSLYGDNPKYVIGAYKNIELINSLLSEWSTTIFCTKLLTNEETIKNLSQICRVIDPTEQNLSVDSLSIPAFWRFFSFFNDGPALSRDLDSRICEREVSYISMWLKSNKNIFIIRDHPWQSIAPAGLIGMKNHGNIFKDFFINFVKNNSVGWGQDQVILEAFIEHNNLKDDILYCSYDTSSYIPRDNKSFFIGIQLDENDMPICPQSLSYLTDINL